MGLIEMGMGLLVNDENGAAGGSEKQTTGLPLSLALDHEMLSHPVLDDEPNRFWACDLML